MRTTVDIDADVLEAARAIAAAEGRSLGQVVTRLARRGLAPPVRSGGEGGFPTFAVPPGSPPLTPDAVRRALDDG